MDTLYFDIVTSLPHTTQSRVHGRQDYPARLLQVALLDSSGELLFKSYLQPEELDWEETSDGTYLHPSIFKRKHYPTQQQVIEQIQPYLKEGEVVVYGLHDKWSFVTPFIGQVRQKSCSKISVSYRLGTWNKPAQLTFEQAQSEILFPPQYSPDTGLRDAESVAKGSRALWLYANSPSYRNEVEARREYYLINPIVERLIEAERRPLDQQRTRIYAQLERGIFQGAGIIMPSYERSQEARAMANTFCEALTGHSLYMWEKYGEWMDAPTISWPYPAQLLPDYKIKRLRSMQPVSKIDNREYRISGDRFTFLFDPANHQLGIDYVPKVQYPPGGTYSASALKKQFKLKEAQIKELQPAAFTHGLWGEYFLYAWPTNIAQ